MSGGVINYTYTISLHLGYPRQDDVCYQCRAADKQHLDAFLRRAVGLRAGLYSVPSRWTKPASVGF